MAHDPKLEIYKLILKRKDNVKPISFRELFRVKTNHYNQYSPKPKIESEIFKIYFQDFIEAVGLDRYKTTGSKTKGFTISTDDISGKIKTHMSLNSDEMFISGILDGGRYNAERWLGVIDDTKKKSRISRKNIVSDRFYFLL